MTDSSNKETDTDLNPTDLESALAALTEELPTRERALIEFVQARVWLLADRETGADPAALTNARMGLVSDGPNLNQAMLAVFSTETRAIQYQRAHEHAQPHVIAVEAPFAILCVPDRAGIIINPNQSPAFRIGPEAAQMLRNEMNKLQKRSQDGATPTPHEPA